MLSNFFIGRPVFAWVFIIFISVAGIFSLFELPLQQYPQVAPPQVTISSFYPGASSQTLEKTVTQVIEQKLVAIDGLRYFKSESSSSGQSQITLTFETGTNPDIAQIQTQNRVSEAEPSLPTLVQELGITVKKSIGEFLLVVALYSETGKVNQIDIADFISTNLVEEIGRVQGVGRVQDFSPQHAMRIWLDARKMKHHKITASEVYSAISNQNIQLPAGQIGGAPQKENTFFNAIMTSESLMQTPEEFKDILLRVQPDGSALKLQDIARVEIGSESYNFIRRYNRKEAAGFGVYLADGANALATIERVKKRIKEIQENFPSDVKVAYPVDSSSFVKTSILGVVRNLVIAVLLVVIIMYIFLQDYRATLVPVIAIPVVLLGTFSFLMATGYSINILTLFACILAIGMLVDDVIVVTENIKSRVSESEDQNKEETAKKAMKELSGALVGTTMVVWAVFIPMLFFGGSTGVIYENFAITILAAMTLSLIIALTFAPSLCRQVIQKDHEENRFFKWFNKNYDHFQKKYVDSVKIVLKRSKIFYIVFSIIILATVGLFYIIPSSFLPKDDQDSLYAIIQGPQNASFQRMLPVLEKIEDYLFDNQKEALRDMFAILGFSFQGQGQNTGIGFIHLKPYEKRPEEKYSVFNIAKNANRELNQILDEASVFFQAPPPISQLGRSSGFTFQLVNQGDSTYEELQEAKNNFLALARKNPILQNVRVNALPKTAQHKVKLNKKKALAYGVPLQTLNQTLSIAWASTYVNDFIEDGRIKRVYLQADKDYRQAPKDLSYWYVKNRQQDMVPMKELVDQKWTFARPSIQRFNGEESFEIQGMPAQGFSTQEAIDEVERIVKDKLGSQFGVQWYGISYEQIQAGNQIIFLYAIAILAIFLSLAALYESWIIPFSIVAVMPIGIFGSSLFTYLAGQQNDVYFKVGMLLTMTLTAKNAILIVEFAKSKLEDGKELKQAVVEACEMRFRPILMTSLTFFLGILPLLFTSGPGSAAQHSIGWGLIGGIISITTFVIFFSPLFFMGVLSLRSNPA